MKKYFVICTLLLGIGNVNAEVWNQSNNPFPQTSPQTLNNIYESKPIVMQREEKKAKRTWFWQKNTNDEDVLNNMQKIPVYPVQHEGVRENGDYYIFTTGE